MEEKGSGLVGIRKERARKQGRNNKREGRGGMLTHQILSNVW